jgi:hypothetical protein
MDDNSNLTAFEELGPTRPSIYSDKQTQNLAQIKRLVAHLGLRYRPSAQADLEAHAALLALLVTDLADIDHRDLDVAILQHVRRSPFMPKASELIELADDARLERQRAEWIATHPSLPAPEYVQPAPPEPVVPCTPEEARAICEEFGLGQNPLIGVKIGTRADGTTEHFVDRHI